MPIKLSPDKKIYSFCPLTAAAYELTGEVFPSSNFRTAAKVIGFRSDPHQVASAADGISLNNPRVRWMRAQMKKVLLPT